MEQVFFFILVEDAHSRLVGGSNRPNTWYALASLRMVRRTVGRSGHGSKTHRTSGRWNARRRAALMDKPGSFGISSPVEAQSKGQAMIMVLGKGIRAFLVRSLAVMTVVLTYAFGNVGAQVVSLAGISALGVTTAATPANAWRRYRRRRFYGYFPRRRRRFRRWW